MTKLFGTDGVRGTANTSPMTAETALRIGAAVGRYFRRDGDSVHRVVIGKDTRLSGYMFENALTPENEYILDMYQIGYLCDSAELTGPSYDLTEPDGTARTVRFCDFGK